MSKRLGRGLADLITPVAPGAVQKEAPASHETSQEDKTFVWLSVDVITPNAYQPRIYMEPTKLEELADSIREKGLIEPIIVRQQSAE